jgi:hypothetical protein
MRTSKIFSAICAAAVCANFISVRADDTPAQVAARAALEQKMQQLDTQPAATNTETPTTIAVTSSGVSLETNDVPSAETIQRSMMPLPGENQPEKTPQVSAPPETVPTPAPAEIVPAATPIQTPAPTAPVETPAVATPPEEMQSANATRPADTEAQARALQALQQKMSELDKQPAVTPPPAATEVQPALIAPVQVPVEPAPGPVVVAVPETKPMIVAPTPEKSANVNYPGKQLGLKPIEAPPLPISPATEAQLHALDAKYKAGQISPKDYFQQREEILKGQ